jgi:Phage regulatory protein CII (CP76)
MTADLHRKTAYLALQQAVHAAAKRYPGGIGSIAALYGFNPHTLQNKLNPAQPGCINIKEFQAVLTCTRSTRILDAVGAIARCGWIDLGQFDEASERQLREIAVELLHRVGWMIQDLQQGIAKEGVGLRELEIFHQAAAQLLAALHAGVTR